jgi:hypothetical protein
MPNNTTTTTATLNIQTDENTLNRIHAAYQTDTANATHDGPFNDWVLNIILDWVRETEKPAPQR